MSNFSKQYNPAEYESATYKKWEDSGAFSPNKEALAAGKKPYVIMLPPPNVTGSLHMGHALQDTVMDILIRFHRLQGDPTVWVPGTDHAALPANKIIVDQLEAEGIDPHALSREEFLQRADDWYEKTGSVIVSQMKQLGCSCDWSRERFTMDEEYVQAVHEAFVRYYEAGYIYRGERMVNWDPKSQTTVSDIEIDWQEEKTPFYYFRYGPFEIGTARPETKFGDKYVVMHPEDARYQEYAHGQQIEVEWINGPVTATIIKDESADPEFGTGVMTITPWHDATDFAIAERHQLDKQQIIGFDGKLLDCAGECTGLPITEAREKVVAKLKEKGLLVRIDEDYVHNVALNDRGKGVIEPQIMRQWFVDMQQLKTDTITAVENNQVAFFSSRWKKHFLTWMNEVRDWNINRQIKLGHRLPVWWKPGTHGTENEEGNFVVAVEKPPVPVDDPAFVQGASGWEQDPDVLDTWFSSALWPFATLGWPQATHDLATFYPTTTLVTARDILYLWVARMIFSGLELMKGEEYGNRQVVERLPFTEVFIHPTVLAKDGQRMSKSLGTGIDPLELIEKYGADATRFGLMYQMTYDSQAIRFDETAMTNGRNFANKLWNLARFLESLPEREERSVADDWIEHRLAQVANQATELINEYRIGEATRLLYEYIWKEYADWYIEIVKVTGSTAVAKQVFFNLLIVIHPVMPHLTEVIWEKMGQPGLLITQQWPTLSVGEGSSVSTMEQFKDIVTTIRSARALLAIPATETVTVYVAGHQPLPDALAALTRSQLAREKTDTMKAFPRVHSNEPVYIAAASITADSIAQAQAKLSQEKAQLEQYVRSQQQAVENMRGKAPAETVTEREAAIATAQAKIVELEKSYRILST